MKRILWCVLLALLVGLIPAAVSADELWVKNEGGLEVVVHSDSQWQDVTVSGGLDVSDATDAPEGTTSMVAVGPGFEPTDGTSKVCAVTLEPGWVVITADDITSYTIEVACNQKGEDVNPEVLVVIDYEGTRISYDPTETTREAVIAALDLVGPPPPPPDATNTQDWVDPFKTAPVAEADDSDGQSIADMDSEAFLANIDWTGQDTWLWT